MPSSYERVQPVSPRVLSIDEKSPIANQNTKTYFTPPKLGPVLIFRFALTFNVKIVWFGRQVGVFVNKQHTNAIFWVSWFQK